MKYLALSLLVLLAGCGGNLSSYSQTQLVECSVTAHDRVAKWNAETKFVQGTDDGSKALVGNTDSRLRAIAGAEDQLVLVLKDSTLSKKDQKAALVKNAQSAYALLAGYVQDLASSWASVKEINAPDAAAVAQYKSSFVQGILEQLKSMAHVLGALGSPVTPPATGGAP